MRLKSIAVNLGYEYISIHAPLTGCDCIQLLFLDHQPNFNPRTPYGMRLLQVFNLLMARLFQSTHPLRDATSSSTSKAHLARYFNPRTPYGMRLHRSFLREQAEQISIHAPLTGCDIYNISILYIIEISIHAPLTGCDHNNVALKSCGIISIHAPLTGCDRLFIILYSLLLIFQSTHPLRDATFLNELARFRIQISIHAPLTGCDYGFPCQDISVADFNPRTPYGMRPYHPFLILMYG